ncbi:MAG: hypothetical protein WD757_06525 [Actinomycetota bacterium]
MRSRVWILLAASLLATAACRNASQGGTAGQGSGAGGQSQLIITSPTEGQEVSNPVHLVMVVNGAEIGPTDTGKMHIHVYYDDSSEYEVVESTAADLKVPAGTKQIRVVLADANHNETDVSTSVRVSVAGTGGAPEEQPPDTTGADDGGYDRGY